VLGEPQQGRARRTVDGEAAADPQDVEGRLEPFGVQGLPYCHPHAHDAPPRRTDSESMGP